MPHPVGELLISFGNL